MASACDEALIVVCLVVASAGCSSTASSEPAQAGCRAGYDGCLGITISNSDPAPYQTSATSDGKGTLYVALLKQCPSLQEQQLSFASEVVSIPNADLTGGQTYSPTLYYHFIDDRFGTTYQAGDHVALGGFLDDDLSVTVPTAPAPNPGDTILSCVDVELARGQNVLVRPVVPCLILAVPPLLFQQTGFGNPCLND
jgi:hypothetical protein